MSAKFSAKWIFKRKKIITFAVIVALVVGLFVFKFGRGSKSDEAMPALTTPVSRGDVELTITGSGTVEPNERYEIIPLVNGEIIESPYEVGDYVEKGSVVYSFDKTDAELNLKRQQNSMKSSTNTYNKTKKEAEKLTIKAPASGTVRDITIKSGDDVDAMKQIATISNDRIMEVDVGFNREQIANIKVGDAATVTNSALMSTISGTVEHIDDSAIAQSTGAALYNVTIVFENPGGVTVGSELGASVNGQISSVFGKARYSYDGVIKTEIAGTVSSLLVKNGDYVTKGQTLVMLSSTDLQSTLSNNELTYENAKLGLEEQMNILDDYSITAPISGTVITKNSKAGDTIDKTNASVTMMVIADISKLKFTLPIDELDVSKVAVGQEVKVTSDAIEGETFTGYITEISMEGESSNGVTTYNATVTIDNPGALKPSMNVDATVVAEAAYDVLRVSSGDIKTAKGKSYVFVKDETASAEEGKPKNKAGKPNSDKSIPNKDEKDLTASVPEAPAGFKTVEITTGIVGNEYTEVLSGLSAGDEVYMVDASSGSDNPFANMMGMMGEMHGGMAMGGGAPGGGAPGGGAPGGGMPR